MSQLKLKVNKLISVKLERRYISTSGIRKKISVPKYYIDYVDPSR